MVDTPLTERVTAARDTITDRAFDGIEQLHVPFTWLTVSPVDGGYEVCGALSLAALPRAEGFREVFAPGAFDAAIVGRDQRGVAREGYDVSSFLYSNSSLLLGSTGQGTLRLVEQNVDDGDYVSFNLTVPAQPYGDPLAGLLANNTPAARSWGIGDRPLCACIYLRVVEDEWSADNDGRVLRTIRRMTLFAVDPEVRPESAGLAHLTASDSPG